MNHKYQEQIDYWQRDPSTGLLKNIAYVFTKEGGIDWQKMVPVEFFVPNKSKFPANTDFKSLDISKLTDDKLLILLAGFKYIARLKGYSSIEYTIGNAGPDFCSTVCKITWKGDFESEMQSFVTSGIGDAHHNNTNNFAKLFCASISQNRAQIRAIKEGCNISILGYEELNDGKGIEEEVNPVYAPPSLQTTLAAKMKEAKIDFNFIKEKIKESHPHSVNWQSLDDIPSSECCGLIERVRVIIEKRKEKDRK